MPLRRELAGAGAEPADDQEAGADDDVEAVEAGGQEEHRRIDAAAGEVNGASEYSMAWQVVKRQAEQHRQAQPGDQASRSPSSSEWCAQVTVRAREQQDHRVQERQVERVEGVDAGRRPHGVAAPETCSGNRAKLKKAQKKPTKNITSLAMNSIMP